MIRKPPAHVPGAKSLDQQKTDFTSEDAPPPGTAGIASHPPAASAVAPLVPPALPHERDQSVETAGAIASVPMQQAQRDLARGLKDTDRGAEAGRTYRKLKGSAN